MSDNNQVLQEISVKLTALLAVQLQSENSKSSLTDQIALLSQLGLNNTDISLITGTTKRTVEVIKSRLNQGKKGGDKK